MQNFVDIYGDDEDPLVPADTQEGEETYQEEEDEGDDELTIVTQQDEEAPTLSIRTSTTPGTSKGQEGQETAEDSGGSASSREGSLSYSAQVAQQFSVYQQTPSQERQQRLAGSAAMTAKTNGVQNGTAPIATLETSTSGEVVYGKKPSEMHDHGGPSQVDAVTIMRDPSGTSRGFAFLTFEDGSVVNSVITREHFLDGKTIDPKRAIPREEHLRNTRYFVGGLSPNTTSDSMKEFFTAFGKVVDATVMLDRETGRSKGFGFVTFEDATNTDQLVGKALTMDDKQIEVKAAQPRSQRDQARSNMNSPTGMAGNTTGTRGESFENRLQATNVPFVQQQNPMSMLYQAQRGAAGSPGMGGAGAGAGGMNQMGMNMNPMAMMNMMNQGMGGMGGMGGMNMMNNMGGMGGGAGAGGMGMMNGMNMMGGGMGNMGGMGMGGNMGGMNNMANMGGMGNMGNMANMANMNPMGGGMRLGMGPMGGGMGAGVMGMGMGMRQGMNNGMTGMNRMQTNAGVGPLRMNNRGQHSFHPYSR
ncbi:hypothetical protein V5O48_011938 [Marasmius crinis-equi]|uniref:RRM domain-containing protein n=1 Tax=Marasmius crinis-equi TaxID=585013 RepID=A0ABR3F485_9AGAR